MRPADTVLEDGLRTTWQQHGPIRIREREAIRELLVHHPRTDRHSLLAEILEEWSDELNVAGK
jgi:hypothetical protein